LRQLAKLGRFKLGHEPARVVAEKCSHDSEHSVTKPAMFHATLLVNATRWLQNHLSEVLALA
jgi:hypothetical protein